MTNSNLTQLLAIVDRSGSMLSCETEMRNALDQFFAEQAKEDGQCVVDYVQFDNQYQLVYRDKPVSEAKAVLEPRGTTALLDAIGRGMTDLGEKLSALPEDQRPGTVLVAIVTDGGENASHEWQADAVRKLIEEQRTQWNWEVIFLGANIDAVATAGAFGIPVGNALTFDTNNSDVAVASMSAYTTTYRGTGNATFTDEDRKNAMADKSGASS